jgi:hypothetical protein
MYRIQLNQTREAWHPITIQDPEAGKVKLRVRYALLSGDEMSALISEGLGEESEGDQEQDRIALLRRALSTEERNRRDRKLADRIVDWEFGDEKGEKLPCTDDIKLAVLNIPYLREPIDKGLFDASRGGQRKNS